jgi:hypothetical protein
LRTLSSVNETSNRKQIPPTKGQDKMKFDEYEKLPRKEKEHFAKCAECGEIFDRRSLDEVLFHHAGHRPRPDIQYSGSEKL